MSKATADLLEQIHGLMAKDMLDRLKSGSCEAKDWAVIVKFLKDNGIDSLGNGDEAGANAFKDLIEAAQKSITNHNH